MDPALLAEIVARPTDDEPRLVLADRLQQAGDPRGEFIAVQCELARVGCAPHPAWDWVGDALADLDPAGEARVRKLRGREAALLKAHRQEWDGSLRERVPYAGPMRFSRGFLAEVSLDGRKADGPNWLGVVF